MIGITHALLVLLLLWTVVDAADRTFPGAEIIVPIALPIIGSILPGLIPGFPGLPGGRPPGAIGLPTASISHSTSIGTTIHHKPIAISHSGSITTSSGGGATSAWGEASSSSGHHHVTAGTGSSTNSNTFRNPLKRWRRIFNSFRRG